MNDEVQKINTAIAEFFANRSHSPGDSFVDHYYSTIEDYIMVGGKRMRPFLVITTYNGLNGDLDGRIYRPSLCVEFLHNASLIHDDIIDRDDTRRGNPAFHFIFKNFYQDHGYEFATPGHFGTTMGILGGDTTFFLGLEALQCDFDASLNEKAIALYCRAYHEICDGVLMEMNFVQVPEVTEEQYLRMISLKTGALIEKSLLIGATYAKAGEETKALLSTYAINLGKAFQVKDDNLGTFGDARKTGKPTDGDIKDGKKTLLLLKALELSNAAQKARLLESVGKEDLTDDGVNNVRQIFKDSGALAYCESKVDEFSNKAIDAVKKLDGVMNKEQREVLIGLVDFNRVREK
ncbi:MAG: polyprenyl synthetase family protein [Promethearchaeota archaeon]